MAKVKTEKPVEEKPVEDNVIETTESNAETTQEPNTQTKIEVEISDGVRNILKLYPNIKELYVDAKGGVYTKPAPAQVIKDAVLYTNPYFKQ